jgi:hypothetical protein
MEPLESRQLMAADLAAGGAVLASPLPQDEHVEVGSLDGSGQPFNFNGLIPQVQQRTLGASELSVIVETTRPRDDAPHSTSTLSNEQLKMAVDQVFAEDNVDADPQLSEKEREKWEQLIAETLRELEERLEVRWQYADGEGGLVTDSFGPDEEWPI